MTQRPVLPAALLKSTQAQYLEKLDDQQFWHYAQELADQTSTLTEPIIQQEEFLACASGIADGRVILSLASLHEILPAAPHLTRLPAAPPWMSGLMAWHGEAIAVVDLAAYLSQYQSLHQEISLSYKPNLLLIAQEADIILGLAVMATGQIPTLTKDQIQPFDATTTKAMQHYAHCIQGLYAGTAILHMPTILTTMVQHL
jgi:chemotaxis signal transduction protein